MAAPSLEDGIDQAGSPEEQAAWHSGFPRIRATVASAPYDSHARTQYRRDA